MFSRSLRPRRPRRGITLVEMLVTVALLVLMMSVIVQIFQAATGAVSAARTYQDLDSALRQADGAIRSDLSNITVQHMTPPINPKNGEGYFEYIENSFPDNQGEDADDCLRFTAKAPEGQYFTGRFVPATRSGFLTQNPSSATGVNLAQYQALAQAMPITLQSQYAEVIYFLRNGNLYRRVLLVAPDQQSAVAQNSPNTNASNFVAGVFSPPATTGALQTLVSWQGLNDLSAHPVPSLSVLGQTSPPAPAAYLSGTIVLNTLGALTNRENRYGAPRFVNDFMTYNPSSGTWSSGSDGIADDFNGDGIADFWPGLYYNVAYQHDQGNASLINETTGGQLRTGAAGFSLMAFPYVYPYAYSRPDPTGLNGYGWIHSPDPNNSGGTIVQLNALNHSPLDIGDSLPVPSGVQTWWGFPTWRETLSPNWLDPWLFPGTPQSSSGGASPSQAPGLNPFPANQLATTGNLAEMLPPMTTNAVGSVSGTAGATTPYRIAPQLFVDANGTKPMGSDTFAQTPSGTASSSVSDFLWKQTWEDDLLLTGVRSFDVKAYDNAFPGYVDLGWGDDGRLLSPYNTGGNSTTPAVPPAVTAANSTWAPPLLGVVPIGSNTPYGTAGGYFFTWPPTVYSGGNPVSSGVTFNAPFLYAATMAHEGRIPPIFWDNRPDYQAPALSPNIGDDTTSVVRLRRTWDTWSTDYSNPNATGVNPTTGIPYGLAAGGAPVLPGYPPPYPASLRGIQIQIRAVDPRNERVKVLTIRHDFSDRVVNP